MNRRLTVALGLGLGGLVLGLALLAREVGPLASPDRRVTLPDASAVTIDTIAVRGRRITVTLNGTVAEVTPAGVVRLAVEGGTVRVRLDDAAAVRVEDRLLVVGRLRARGGHRTVEASSWAGVEAVVRPPAGAGL